MLFLFFNVYIYNIQNHRKQKFFTDFFSLFFKKIQLLVKLIQITLKEKAEKEEQHVKVYS